MSLAKVFFHPDKEEIVKMMLAGVSVQRIEKWLLEKYPENKGRWISIPTLQKFRKEQLNLDKESLDKIKTEKANQLKQRKKKKKDTEDSKEEVIKSLFAPINEVYEARDGVNVINSVQTSATYKEKIGEVSEIHLDVPRKIMELDKLVSSRIEYYFNKVSQTQDPESNVKADRVLVEYIKQLSELYRDWKRLIEGLAEQNSDASLQLGVVQEYIEIIREIVRDLLNDIDPSLAIRFLEQLTDKLNAIEYKHQAIDMAGQSKKLDKQIVKVQQEIANEETKQEWQEGATNE